MRRTPLKRTPFKRKPLKRAPMDPDLRTRVFGRDGWKCQLAGHHDHQCFGRLHAHHRILRSQGGKDTMDNLVTLCMTGHDWVHLHRPEAEALGLIARAAPGRADG